MAGARDGDMTGNLPGIAPAISTEDKEGIYISINQLCDPETRETALLELRLVIHVFEVQR